MASPGQPLFAFRLNKDRATQLREVAKLSGYEHAGEMIREFIDAVLTRNHGKANAILRRVDKGCGVQLDLALMASPGGPVLPQKRVQRALKAKGAGKEARGRSK